MRTVRIDLRNRGSIARFATYLTLSKITLSKISPSDKSGFILDRPVVELDCSALVPHLCTAALEPSCMMKEEALDRFAQLEVCLILSRPVNCYHGLFTIEVIILGENRDPPPPC